MPYIPIDKSRSLTARQINNAITNLNVALSETIQMLVASTPPRMRGSREEEGERHEAGSKDTVSAGD